MSTAFVCAELATRISKVPLRDFLYSKLAYVVTIPEYVTSLTQLHPEAMANIGSVL